MVDRERLWQTKPLDCWGKLKEISRDHYRNIATAREDGKILVTGSIAAPYALLNGLGDDVMFLGGEPYAATVGNIPGVSVQYMAATEERGYARDLCGYMRNYWGSMFANRYFFTDGPFPKPHFCFTENICDAGHGKWYQVVSEHFGIPSLVVDIPIGPLDGRLENRIEYVVAQLHDCIEQMEKITGRTYDDEKFIEASRTFFQCESLWGEICLLNSAVPATLDLKTIVGLLPNSMLFRNKPETLEALKLLRDEVKDRIKHQIAAAEYERTRLICDLPPPWHMLRDFRRLEERGVVVVGTRFYLTNGGDADFREDGTVGVSKTPDELGWPMKTREDTLRIWARKMQPKQNRAWGPETYTNELISLHHHWKSEGILMQYNRGCALLTNFLPEVKMLLESAGIPVVAYEGNFTDVRDTDASQILKRVNAFIDLVEANSGKKLPA